MVVRGFAWVKGAGRQRRADAEGVDHAEGYKNSGEGKVGRLEGWMTIARWVVKLEAGSWDDGWDGWDGWIDGLMEW